MKQIILFNGPPRSGKDEGARCLWRKGYDTVRLAEPLYNAVKAFYNVSDSEWQTIISIHKDTPHAAFFGKTLRDALKAMAEQFAKPLHGRAVFARIACDVIERSSRKHFAIPDLGFPEELGEFAERFGVESLAVVHLQRSGTNYDNDTRGFVDPQLISNAIAQHPIRNNGYSLRDYHKTLENLFCREQCLAE